MKTLISTLILAGSLVIGGCGEKTKEAQKEVKNNKILNNGFYERDYHIFTFAGDTIEASKYECADEHYYPGIAIRTTKKCTTYLFKFSETKLRDSLLDLCVFSKNFRQEYLFWKNSDGNSFIEKEVEAKGYALLKMYNDILNKERLKEYSIKREEQKRIDEIVLKNL